MSRGPACALEKLFKKHYLPQDPGAVRPPMATARRPHRAVGPRDAPSQAPPYHTERTKTTKGNG
jgi:hypothetical protein